MDADDVTWSALGTDAKPCVAFVGTGDELLQAVSFSPEFDEVVEQINRDHGIDTDSSPDP